MPSAGHYVFFSILVSAFVLLTGTLRLDFDPISPCPLRIECLWQSADAPLSTGLYLTRSRWLPYLPIPGYIYTRLPTSSTFAGDIDSGFTSNDFDLQSNLEAGDSRAGLDAVGKREVQRLMRSRKVGFDEARRMYTVGRFAKNNIGPDGRPRDPKFVSFS